MTATVSSPPLPAALPRRRSVLRGLATFFRRAPLSAFWGVIAALIIGMAVAAPAVAPYAPLKSSA